MSRPDPCQTDQDGPYSGRRSCLSIGLTMESQINGGMIQSLGMALWEGRVMDAQLGMQLNPGFGDYKLPGCTRDAGDGSNHRRR